MFCEVAEIDFLQREHPEALPTSRQISVRADGAVVREALPAPEKAAARR
jgi:hypothetical protein